MSGITEKINQLDQNSKLLLFLVPVFILGYFLYEEYTETSYLKEDLESSIQKNKAANYNYKIQKLKIKIRKQQQKIPNLNTQVDNKKDEVYAMKDKLQGGVKALLSPMAIASIVQDVLSWSISQKVDLINLTRSYVNDTKKRNKRNDRVSLKQVITVEGSSSYSSFLKFLKNVEEMKMMSKVSDIKFNIKKNKINFTYKMNIYGITLEDEEI